MCHTLMQSFKDQNSGLYFSVQWYLIHKTEMDLHRMQNPDMSLVLSTDPKPRLKWTPELHQRFIVAVAQLGGAYKATPRTVMRVMGIPELTLYQLKSHLQKYRLGKNQSEILSDNIQEDFSETDYRDRQNKGGHISGEIINGTHTQNNGSSQIAQALKMQMEVQKKLHEQIEVQRHLQLRIEAQGKYLQSVLKKAEETLVGYNSSSLELKAAKAELFQLVSMVDTRCPSFASFKGSGRKDDKQPKEESGDILECDITSIALPLMEIHPNGGHPWKTGPSNCVSGQKRSGSTISLGNCIKQPSTKRSPTHEGKSGNQLRKIELPEKLDLNSQYQSEIDSGQKLHVLDLNCRQTEPFVVASKHFGT